jgi:RimJ/RimL family protein N-acetyltransferase
LNTKNLILSPHLPPHLLALMESEPAYEESAGLRTSPGVREFLLAGSPGFAASLEAATEPDPWKFGFAIVHKTDIVMIGLCGFAGPPDAEGVAEIAYSIAPAYQGKGLATEAAGALVNFATKDPRVRKICAHTLAETSASTRVLEKSGFRKVREIIDSENNLIWRWEYNSP